MLDKAPTRTGWSALAHEQGMPLNDMKEHYSDIAGYFSETLCITWCEGLTLDEVAVVFGSGPDTGLRYDLVEAENAGHEAREEAGGVACSAIAGQLGSWLVVVEPDYGDTGSDHETLRALSAKGKALNVYSGVNSHSLDYYVNAQPLTVLQFMEWGEEPFHRQGEQPHLLDDLVGDFSGKRATDFQAFALALAERMTGVRLTHDWLFDKHRWLRWENWD
ncbi:DUF6461 domain-containing protein [Nonomuraea bangladeshensis]|uniref:DUF6461 domain-containing protein n=1 Tax=Nonomuraea bangladeshensis TaxID=404385 RepID=UPI0031DBEC0F